jgi:hypothetical protein
VRLSVYVAVFIALSALVVPVPFFLGFGGIIAPCCYMWAGLILFWHWERVSILELIYLVLYSGLFLGTGWMTFQVSKYRVYLGEVRLLRQLGFFALVLSFSFLPMITYGGLGGNGGTYDFWNACIRFAQHYWPAEKNLLGL